MSNKITYQDKEALINDETIADKNKVTADDMNQIKQVVNENADELGKKQPREDGKGLSTNDFTNEEKQKLENLENYDDKKIKDDISEIKTEQTTQNNRLNNLETDNAKNKDDILTNTQNIKDIKLEQTTQNTSIEALQAENKELKEKVTDLEKNTITSTPELSTNYYLTDSAKSKARVFLPEGNSKQETTEGYNIMNFDVTQDSKVTVNDDGTITINGTGGFSVAFKPVTLEANQTYKQKIEIVSGSVSDNIYNALLSFKDMWLTPDGYVTYTPTADEVKRGIWVNASKTFNNLRIKIWGYKGTDEKPFEKATDGASPNPSYEQPIKSAGDNGSINEKIVNKNLFDNTVIRGKAINSSGEIIDNSNFMISDFILVGENQTITLSFLPKISLSQTTRLHFYNENKSWISQTSTLSKTESRNSLSATTPSNCKYARISICKNYEEIMINKGTSTPFVEHQEQNYSIPVQQPLRSIGDVRDKFVKVDGNWFERHNIIELILNGSQDVFYISTQNNYILAQFDPNIGAIDLEMKCNRLPIASNWNKDIESIWRGGFNSNLLQIKLLNSRLSSLDDKGLNNYLNLNNIKVYCKLNDPIYLPCTQEQIDVLENLPSTYKNVTHIISEDDTPAFIDLEYVRDLETVINNLTTRVEVVESES